MSLRTMKFFMYFDLVLVITNAYVGVAAFARGDYLWTAVGLGLSFFMLYNYNRRKEIIKMMENNEGNRRDKFISRR